MDSTNETNKYRWYVLRAVTQQEDKIKKHIESEIKSLGLEEFVPRVLVPVEKVFTIRNGKKVMKEKNFYSGYVFVEAYFERKENGEYTEVGKKVKGTLRQTPGVLGFLGGEENPESLRQQEVMRLLGKADELMENEEEAVGTFMVGESVKVTDGPFASFVGVIKEINNEGKKLKIEVNIFDQPTSLELSYYQVSSEL